MIGCLSCQEHNAFLDSSQLPTIFLSLTELITILKTEFDPEDCPLDCSKPCERVCPADAISLEAQNSTTQLSFHTNAPGAFKVFFPFLKAILMF